MGAGAPRRRSPAAAGPSDRARTAAGTSVWLFLRECRPQVVRGLSRPLERDGARLAPAPDLRLDLAGLDRTPADRQPQRAADQLRVGELRAGAEVAVVVDHVEPEGAQLLVERVRELALFRVRLAEPDQVHVERRQRTRPGDALLVGELLDRRGADPRRADAVRAHPDR